jgi:hypothetical protein
MTLGWATKRSAKISILITNTYLFQWQMDHKRRKYGIKYAKKNLSMGRWPDRGGLDVGSDCVEGAATESGGGRGNTTSQQPAARRAAPSNNVGGEEGERRKERRMDRAV